MADGASYSIAEYVEEWAQVEALSASLDGVSLADRLALCERDEPGITGALLDELGPEGVTTLAFDRRFWLRPRQLAIHDGRLGLWRILLLIAGRGEGKTRTATEWIVDRLERGAREILLVAPTYDDARQYLLGGHKRRADADNGSGLLDVLPPWIECTIREDDHEIEFTAPFRAVLHWHSAESPEYRGPAPDTVVGDELIKWRYPERLISNIRLACRAVGRLQPQMLFITSPKKGKRFLRDLVMDPDVVTLTSDTKENRGNVDEAWYRSEERRLRGTAQGEEELGGKLTVEDESQIFKISIIDAHRVERPPTLDRIAIAVDPSGSKASGSDEAGVVALGRAGDIHSGHAYILEDKSGRQSWDSWGIATIELVERLGASAIVLERNHFADAAANNLRNHGAPRGWRAEPRPGFKHLVDLVRAGQRVQIIEVLATKDKPTRARPVATLYEQGRVHHVGHLVELEGEQSDWDPSAGFSPGRIDALVHGMTELFQLDKPPRHDGKHALTGIGAANAKLDASAPRRPQWLAVGRDRRRTV